MKQLNAFAWLILIFACAVAGYAQKPETAPVPAKSSAVRTVAAEDLKLASKLMAREMPYRVITPKNYAAAKTEKFAVIYLLHGLTGHFDNWADKTKLKEIATAYNYIIVTPEGNNGWYTNSATLPNEKYESYIIEELVPEIDKNYRTLNDRRHRAIAGLSMGGYGAIKFGLKYPDRFALVGSFSGALGAASWNAATLGNGWKALTDSIMSVYGADESPTRRENDIYKIVREMSPENSKNLPFIYLDCGTEDFLIQQNRDFANLLLEKKIPHEFRQLPGKHDWDFWNAQVEEFLEIAERRLK